MRELERTSTALRHSRLLRDFSPLWSVVRPIYKWVLRRVGKTGLPRNMNGSDTVLVLPELYTLPETYEPDVWCALMREVHAGDVIGDVGANIGLYTVALAKRVGPGGHVYAFEPDPQTVDILRRHIDINGIGGTASVLPCVVGDREGMVDFTAGRESESHVGSAVPGRAAQVPSVTLDSVFAHARVDILKIDVEGFEEHVLRGGLRLLGDPARAPATIFLEVHPAAWEVFGTTSGTLLSLLRRNGYEISDVAGNALETITHYGEVVARRVARTGDARSAHS